MRWLPRSRARNDGWRPRLPRIVRAGAKWPCPRTFLTKIFLVLQKIFYVERRMTRESWLTFTDWLQPERAVGLLFYFWSYCSRPEHVTSYKDPHSWSYYFPCWGVVLHFLIHTNLVFVSKINSGDMLNNQFGNSNYSFGIQMKHSNSHKAVIIIILCVNIWRNTFTDIHNVRPPWFGSFWINQRCFNINHLSIYSCTVSVIFTTTLKGNLFVLKWQNRSSDQHEALSSNQFSSIFTLELDSWNLLFWQIGYWIYWMLSGAADRITIYWPSGEESSSILTLILWRLHIIYTIQLAP